MIQSSSPRRRTTLAGVFTLAAGSVLLLCGAGAVPIENLLPQGPLQGDLNVGGHNLTNAGTISATNVVVSGTFTPPAGFGSSSHWTAKSAAYASVAGDRLALNSSTNAFSVSLPSAAGSGAEIDALDAAGQCAVHNVTFTGTINGSTNLVFNIAGGTVRFVDVGGSVGWRAN